ncbi:hypothetical protein V8E52_000320 [Russula decolorans]
MGKSVTKIVYKPDPNASDIFLVIVNPVEFKKWKDGDRTIPLVEGLLRHPSKQELDNEFGTHVDVEVVQQILEKGEEAGESLSSGKWGSKNDSRGSAFLDNRGGNRTTGI